MDARTKQFVNDVYAALEAADVIITHDYQQQAWEELRLFLKWAWEDAQSWAEVEEKMESNDRLDSPEVHELLGHLTLFHIARNDLT